jgi:hypothetical protein
MKREREKNGKNCQEKPCGIFLCGISQVCTLYR